MNDIPFHATRMGQRFYERTLPAPGGDRDRLEHHWAYRGSHMTNRRPSCRLAAREGIEPCPRDTAHPPPEAPMSNIDETLDKYELRDLESALARRRGRAGKKLSSLVARRRKLESDLRAVEREIKAARSDAGLASGSVQRRPNARRLNDISLADALERVLKGRKRPMHYKALTETVVARKLYLTKSKNLLSTIAVTLKRDKRFKKTELGYYSLC